MTCALPMLRYLIMGGSSKQRKSNSKQTSVHSPPKKVTDAEASASGLARRQRQVRFTLQSHSSLGHCQSTIGGADGAALGGPPDTTTCICAKDKLHCPVIRKEFTGEWHR